MYKSRGETCRTEVYPSEGYVVKQFVPRKSKFGKPVNLLRGSLDLCFHRELECLSRLKNNQHFPQILDHNSIDCWIKMTYVGEHHSNVVLGDANIYHDQVDEIVEALKAEKIKLAYEWNPGDGRIGYCLSMMMFKDDLLSLIDFERAWPVGCDRESEFSKLFVDSFKMHDDEKFKDTLKKTISTLYEKK